MLLCHQVSPTTLLLLLQLQCVLAKVDIALPDPPGSDTTTTGGPTSTVNSTAPVNGGTSRGNTTFHAVNNATRIYNASTTAAVVADSGNVSSNGSNVQGNASTSNVKGGSLDGVIAQSSSSFSNKSLATPVPNSTSAGMSAMGASVTTTVTTTLSASATTTESTASATNSKTNTITTTISKTKTSTNTMSTTRTATTSKTNTITTTISKTTTDTATTSKTTTRTTSTKTLNPELNPAAQGLDTASIQNTEIIAPAAAAVGLPSKSQQFNASWLKLPNVSVANTVCSVARIAGVCPDVGTGRLSKQCVDNPGACCPVSHRNCSSSNPMAVLFGVCPKSMGASTCVGSNAFSTTNVGVCMCLVEGARCGGTADKPICITRGTPDPTSSQLQVPPGVENGRTYFQGKSAADVGPLALVTYNYFGILLWTAAGGLTVVAVRRGLGRLLTRRSEGVAVMVRSPVFDEESIDAHLLTDEF